MRAPSTNPITTEAHGKKNAVDYDSIPDNKVYAPTNCKFVRYEKMGDLGNVLVVKAKGVIYRFAHLKKALVEAEDSIKEGDPIAIMGNTGKVQSINGDGTHLHHDIELPDGTFIYPPDFYDLNEAKEPQPEPAPTPRNVKIHTVKEGEMLSTIAPRYRISWRALYLRNKKVIGPNPDLIHPGQQLVVPKK